MKRFVVTMLAFASLGACHRATVRGDDYCQHPYRLSPTGRTPRLPVAPVPQESGMATIVGYAADSTSGMGLDRALVRLNAIASKDSVAMTTDSQGEFTITGVQPGRYRYRVLSTNFHPTQDSVVLQPGVNSLRVALQRGPALCRVTMR